MGIKSILQNFANGFGLGLISRNFGCYPSFYTPCGCFNMMHAVPDIMSGMSFYPLMTTSQMPNFNTSLNCNQSLFNYSQNYTSALQMVDSFTSQGISIPSFTQNFYNTAPMQYQFAQPSFGTNTSNSATESKDNSSNSQKTAKINKDEFFNKMVKHIMSQEGEYSNHPKDKGGATYHGVIQSTYNGYRTQHKLPVRDVRQMTDEEMREIYYSIYTACGADKIEDPKLAAMVFDIAFGSGPAAGKKLYQQSGGDLKKLEALRRQFYYDIVKRDPSQKDFIKGWQNRVTHTMQFIETLA